ncbi:MAG TPA: PEPxxWA-CTERM sorting domain-containing protein, partial [Sphingomonas sp.]|nr:PEPxxWA-CTERM sorting domain-containing protein [Sphingomonas sp.]
GDGSLKTITFSKPVSDVYLALVSWNGNAGVFNQPFEVISEGCGYWGCGSFANVTPVSFTGNGELHGIIRFTGSFSSVSFTDLSEHWHGIQIGIAGLAPPLVPEPASWALMVGGFGLAGMALRRRSARLSVA